MSKAILVIDMPESCDKCPLFNDVYNDMCCLGLNNRTIDYPYPKDFRQDWCPLKIARAVENNANPLFIDEFVEPSIT